MHVAQSGLISISYHIPRRLWSGAPEILFSNSLSSLILIDSSWTTTFFVQTNINLPTIRVCRLPDRWMIDRYNLRELDFGHRSWNMFVFVFSNRLLMPCMFCIISAAILRIVEDAQMDAPKRNRIRCVFSISLFYCLLIVIRWVICGRDLDEILWSNQFVFNVFERMPVMSRIF